MTIDELRGEEGRKGGKKGRSVPIKNLKRIKILKKPQS